MISRALVKFLIRALTSYCRPHPLLTGKRRDSSDRWWLVSPCWNKRCQRSSSHRWPAGWESFQARPQIWRANYIAKYSLDLNWDCWHEFKENCLKLFTVHLHVFQTRELNFKKCALEQISWICWQVFVWKRIHWWEYKRLLSFNTDKYFYSKATKP